MKTANYNNKHVLTLLETEEELTRLRSKLDGVSAVAVNLETTGVDYDKDSIAGVNVAYETPRGVVSVYMPIRHTVGVNLKVEPVLALVGELIKDKKVLFYKRDFAFSFLEKEGVEVGLNDTHDVQIMLYLCSNKSCPTRNEFARLYFPDLEVFDIDVTEVEFSARNPEVAFIFAAQKGVLSFLLARYVWAHFPMIGEIYKLDNKSSEVVRWFSKTTRICFDRGVVRERLQAANEAIESVKFQARSVLGYDIDLSDYAARIEVLRGFINIDSNATTITSSMLAKCNHPIARLFERYGELASYKSVLEKMLGVDGDSMRIHYATVTAKTGRLTSGHLLGNSYFTDFNIHNVPKEEVVRYVHKTDGGIGFTVDDNKEGAVKEVKCKGGLRDAFVPPSDEYVWVSCDYSGEEMCLVANFSQDENLLEPIRNGEDIHSYVAEKVFGVKDVESRTKTKQLNFSVLYGAGEYSVAKQLGVSVDESRALLEKYFSTMHKLAEWRDRMIRRARQKGYVCTLFGRPRMLYADYQSSDRFVREAADRFACNSPIQGCTPLHGHLETKDCAVRMEKAVGRKQVGADGKEFIPTHRGDAEPLFVLFRSGDYIICDNNHGLIYGSKRQPKVASMRGCFGRKRVWLAPLRRKSLRFNWSVIRRSLAECASLFVLTCMRDDVIRRSDKNINSALFKLALFGRWFDANYKAAISMRSVASVFGYNVVYSEWLDKYRVTFRRARKSRVKRVTWCFDELRRVEVGTCTAVDGFQTYVNQGFVNKNTGADILRIVLCRFKRLFDEDAEWAANVKFACTIHDECNFYVRKEYLRTACRKIYDTMYFEHELLTLPVKGNLSVGKDWGHLVEIGVDDIDESNKVKI